MKDFPITALVGYDDAILAISAMLCYPYLQSVLIAGGSDAWKSVAARSSYQLSESMDVVVLPPNSDRGQVFGTLDLEKDLRTGRTDMSEFVLHRANRNILAIEDANLMDQSLLLSILDAAKRGIAVPELGSAYLVNLKIICTMNPEDGEIDPQVLDMFDMCVFIEPMADESKKKEMARRCQAF